MQSSFQDSLSRLNERMVDLLWHQWSSIGVAGYSRAGDDRVIDPEALLLATTRFGRHDSRLMDESNDWLVKHGRRISLQRLQGLHRAWPRVADSRVLAAIAEVLAQKAAHRKWQVIAERIPSEPESLFFSRDGSPAIHFGEADPVFEKHGLLRGKLEHRGMSQPPDPNLRENLIFTLRALFGVNARAEIMAWLLTHESGHPAAIARDIGYFSKSVQQTLNEMEDSGHIRSRRDGREKIFWVKPGTWDFLITWSKPSSFPRWVDWMSIFSAITTFIDALGEPGLDDASEQIQAIQVREALDAAMPALSSGGLAESFNASRKMIGGQLIGAIKEDLGRLMQALEGKWNR